MKNLFETTIELGSFKTLVKAFQDTDLVDTLSNDGPFTMFAPTDKAFSKLPSNILEYIFHDIEKLTEILTYHVVSNSLMINDVTNLNKIKTVNGNEVKFYK